MKSLLALLVVTSTVGFAEEAKNLLKPINKAESWRMEEHEGGKGTLKIDGDAVVITSTKVTGTDWHVQAVMSGLELKEGQEYVLKFKAKADGTYYVGVNFVVDEGDYHQIGLGEQVVVTKALKENTLQFRAENVSPNKRNRITIVVGLEACQVTITEMTLTAK